MAILQNFRCARRWKNRSEEVREIERVVGNLERNGAGAFQNTFLRYRQPKKKLLLRIADGRNQQSKQDRY
jgi:hypothetical protein